MDETSELYVPWYEAIGHKPSYQGDTKERKSMTSEPLLNPVI